MIVPSASSMYVFVLFLIVAAVVELLSHAALSPLESDGKFGFGVLCAASPMVKNSKAHLIQYC